MNKMMMFVAVLAAFFLFGCQPAATVAPIEENPESEIEETALPAENPLAELPPSIDYCLECHTDQEQLTALAKPEVEAEGESKGVG